LRVSPLINPGEVFSLVLTVQRSVMTSLRMTTVIVNRSENENESGNWSASGKEAGGATGGEMGYPGEWPT
jgi:hypothetical protein